ncbi:hypothetical protein [Paeniglutamicibacter kerguelensis]|uniref:hypothetical protein n=1 Tax=Paeniglutamicibacter kerguelensis TaxID=254788 RepID=UPI003607BF32
MMSSSGRSPTDDRAHEVGTGLFRARQRVRVSGTWQFESNRGETLCGGAACSDLQTGVHAP